MKRVYVDTEYCYPGMRRGTPRPTSDDTRQIVQIAAIIYDDSTGREYTSFDQLVTPIYQKRLPKFFIELTEISQHDVDRCGRPFSQVFDDFRSFCEDYEVRTFHKDEEVLRQNCAYINKQWLFSKPFIQVKKLLPKWSVDPDAYSSGTLYKAAGLDMQGHVHNALHDVRSMAAAVHTLERKASEL